MSLYTTRQTPVPWDEPPHMARIPRPRTRSTGQVGTTLGPPHPNLGEGNEPDHPLLGERITCPHSPGLIRWKAPQPRRLLSTSLNMYCLGHPWHQLGSIPSSPICPTILVDTLRVAHEGDPPRVPRYPTASPSHGAPSTFMELLSQMTTHSWKCHTRRRTCRQRPRLGSPTW